MASFEGRMRTLLEKRRYCEGIDAASVALRRAQVAYGMKSLQAAICHYWLGVLYCRYRQYKDAYRELYRAKEIQMAFLGEEHWRTVRTLYEEASVYYQNNLLAEALRKYEHTLLLEKKVFGAHDLALAPTLEQMGHCCSRLGRFDEAAQRYTEAWHLRSNALGRKHSQTRAVQRWRNAATKRKVPADITADSGSDFVGFMMLVGGVLFAAYAVAGETGLAVAFLLPLVGFAGLMAFGLVQALTNPRDSKSRGFAIGVAAVIALVLLVAFFSKWHKEGRPEPYNDEYEVWLDQRR
jgi:tetratricopeptide (TPR) repeat protein